MEGSRRRISTVRMVWLDFDGPWLLQAVSHPMADGLMNHDAWQTLRQKRIAVVDSAVPLEVVAKVQMELQALRSSGVMQNDTNDVCNPLQEAKYLPFAAGNAAQQFREKCPITMQVMQRLAGLATILEDELGLRLAVPQSAMAACYPPRASYKMHLDSYFLHGCKDDIPRKVTVLLYCNHGWEPRQGGELRAWEPFDQGRGVSQRIEPLAGRLVVFMSEEIWHEVLESHGDRYALTVVDRFSFVEDPRPGTLRKQPTFRMQLLSERMSKSQSAGELRKDRGNSLPALSSTPSFVNLGRTRPPIVR
eukprot:s59_g72.t1